MNDRFEIELLFLQKVSEGGFDEMCIMYFKRNDDFASFFDVQFQDHFLILRLYQMTPQGIRQIQVNKQ